MNKKNQGENNILKDFIMNAYQLNSIRNTSPKVHLYEQPIIGTEEVRQYSYCKRRIYFRYVLNAPKRETYKMKYGTEEHERLQKKMGNSEKDIQKYYNIYLTLPKLGLVGLIDYFIFDGHQAFPVEIKTGNIPKGTLNNPDKMQVTAQAILLENNFDFLVNKVKIYYSKSDTMKQYSINGEDKFNVIKKVRAIQNIIISETMPEKTPIENRCRDCECKNYCLGV